MNDRMALNSCHIGVLSSSFYYVLLLICMWKLLQSETKAIKWDMYKMYSMKLQNHNNVYNTNVKNLYL